MKILRFAALVAAIFATGYTAAAPVQESHAVAKSASIRWQKCTADYISAVLEEGRKKHPTTNNCIRVSGTTAWADAIAHCGPRPTI